MKKGKKQIEAGGNIKNIKNKLRFSVTHLLYLYKFLRLLRLWKYLTIMTRKLAREMYLLLTF